MHCIQAFSSVIIAVSGIQSQLPCRKVKERPNRLKCTAQHTSFIFPTDKLEPVIVSPIRVMADTTSKATSTVSLLNTASISAATTTVADCNMNNTVTTDDSNVNEPAKSYNAEEYYKVQLERKEKEIVHLKKQLENSKKLVNFYKMKASSSGAASNSAATSTSRAVIDAQVINQIHSGNSPGEFRQPGPAHPERHA